MPTTRPDLLRIIPESLESRGWAVVPDAFDADGLQRLAEDCQARWQEGEFRRAAVGRGASRVIREDIRRDHVMWLEPGGSSPAQDDYLAGLDPLREAINRRLFLGLFEFEGHFATYPPGGFYKAHLDRHQGTLDRVVTVILYLNRDWQPGDGGELRLWTEPGRCEGAELLVEPRFGTLVVFLAGEHWHEVLPSRRDRMSVTGWFRTRG